MLKLAIVYEAPADAKLGSCIADRVIVSCIEWLHVDPDLLAYQREWITDHKGVPFRWDRVDDLGRNINFPIRGRFDDEKDYPDFRAAVRVLRTIQFLFDDIDAVVLIRDLDNQPERANGLEQAKNRFDEKSGAFRVVVGAAQTKRECWVLAGFFPRDDFEKGLLEEERRYLGFDPTTKSHELTAKNSENKDKRSAKRVLKKLTQENLDREEECWTCTPLDELRSKGQTNGLADYLQQVEEVLVPMVRRG